MSGDPETGFPTDHENISVSLYFSRNHLLFAGASGAVLGAPMTLTGASLSALAYFIVIFPLTYLCLVAGLARFT